MVSRQNSVCLGSSLSMRSFAIEEPGSPVPALYATLVGTRSIDIGRLLKHPASAYCNECCHKSLIFLLLLLTGLWVLGGDVPYWKHFSCWTSSLILDIQPGDISWQFSSFAKVPIFCEINVPMGRAPTSDWRRCQFCKILTFQNESPENSSMNFSISCQNC